MAVSFDPVLLQPRGNFPSLLEHWTNIKGPSSVWASKICSQISAKSQYLLIAQYDFNAWISQEVQLSQNGAGWSEEVQPPRRWQWWDTLFLPVWGGLPTDFISNRMITTDDSLTQQIKTSYGHSYRTGPTTTFSVFFRAFQAPQRLSEHYFIVTASLKHLSVCKYLN